MMPVVCSMFIALVIQIPAVTTMLHTALEGRATYLYVPPQLYIDCISESQYQVVEKDQDSDNDARDQGNTPHLKYK